MDGRVQLPIIQWMRKQYAANYVDMITEPGPIKILAENRSSVLMDSLREKVKISINKHNSTCVAVIGHFDCAGNTIGKKTQIKQIKKSLKRIQSRGFSVPLIGLWVDEHWRGS